MKTKTHFANYLTRAAMMLLALLTSIQGAWATDYISDVKLIGGTKNEVETLKSTYISQGWTVINRDLNAGCGSGSDYIYLLYKTTTSSTDGAYITDFYLREGKNPPASLTHDSHTYMLAAYDGGNRFVELKGDLNSNADGDFIYLYYTKDVFPDLRAVTDITFNTLMIGAVGKNGGVNGYDLNSGCGSGSDYIYMHINTEAVPVSGVGTEANPYVIHNETGWDKLVASVRAGNTYSGQYIKLGADLCDITTMVGTISESFNGHFDGNGKSLSVNISGNVQAVAPFYNICDATLMNLTVKGSVSSTLPYAAGLVGFCSGTASQIKNCNVETAVSGPTYIGGIVGAGAGGNNDALTMEDCIFSGSLNVSDSDGLAGGLIGRCNNLTFTVNNCLYKGSSAGSGHIHPIDCCHVNDNARGKVTHTYYLNSLDITFFPADHSVSHTNGIAVSETPIEEIWDEPVVAVDGQTYYARSHYVKIGDEDETLRTSRLPLETSKNYSFSQQVITAEEIGTAGTITSIAYRLSYPFNKDLTMDGVQIYIKTNKRDYIREVEPVSESDKVFEGTFSAKESGWATIQLDKPFEYDGVSNLLVCCIDPTNGSTDKYYFTYHLTKYWKCLYYSSDDIVPDRDNLCNIKDYYPTSSSSDIRFYIVPSPFSKPSNLAVRNRTENSVTLRWDAPETNESIIGYVYKYKRNDEEQWSNEITVDPHTSSVYLTGLSANTDYSFWMKTVYAEGESIFEKCIFTTPISLPYEDGFENKLGHWGLVNCNVDVVSPDDIYYKLYTGIRTNAKHNGDVGFRFNGYNSNIKPQYLISPAFSGTSPITMSFYYRNQNYKRSESFQVGYSTTNDINDFIWSDLIDVDSDVWLKYENTFPAGASYFAIKYVSNSVALFVDDFNFEVYSSYAKPDALGVGNLTDTEATLLWKNPDGAVTGYAYQYRKENESTWSVETTMANTSVTLSELSPNTKYIFRVKALYAGGNASNYVSVRFMTESGMVSLPYYEDFESGMGGWRVIEEGNRTSLGEDISFNGSNSFTFWPSSSNIYLMSPWFEGNKAIKMTFWSANSLIEGTSYPATFYVGYSTTTRNLSAFKWITGRRSSENWTQCTDFFPVGTKYVAIRYLGGGVFTVDDFSFTAEEVISIDDNADNRQTIIDSKGKEAIVTLSNHTFYRNSDWNTLCLPFSIDDLTDTPLNGATVKTLSSTVYNNGALTLNFKDTTGIEAGKPYIVKWNKAAYLSIKTKDDWNTFAQSVASGQSYAGKTILLNNDISISTMVGTSEHPFDGIFEGNGKTLSLNISDTGEGTAPFHYIRGATLCNLKTKGTVEGGDYCSGLVGFASGGTNTIHNCTVEVEVSSNGSYVSGIIGHGTTSFTTVRNCIFCGKLVSRTKYIGVIYGDGDKDGTHIIENCLADGEYTNNYIQLEMMLASGDNCSVTNCYRNYLAFFETQGKYQIFDNDLEGLQEALGDNWVLDSNSGHAALRIIPSGIISYTNLTSPIFKGVVISNATANFTSQYVDFIGITSPMAITKNNNTKLFLGEGNTLYHPSENMTIGSCHAYFLLPFGLGTSSTSDVNGDGTTTVTDVMMLVNHILGNASDNFIIDNADVNGDGTISVTDVMLLVKKVLQGSQGISNIVINFGDSSISYGGGGTGPARTKKEEED